MKPTATLPLTASLSTMSASQNQEMITLPSGASYPKSIEPLTENEQALLDTYELIKHYEKESQRLKAEEAKRRLEEANERYQAKVRERERAEGRQNDDEDEAKEQPSKREYESDVDEEAIERRKKKAEEIARLRKDVSAAQEAKSQQQAEKQAARKREEDMRRQLLGESKEDNEIKRKHDEEEDDNNNDDEDPVTSQAYTGPSIKKKQRVDDSWDQKPKPSLISNLTGNTTPVHDFSKKLGMSKGSLDGEVLYPGEGDVVPWEPPQKPVNFLDGCLQLELPDFDPSLAASGSGNNTVAIKFHAPNESSRFSINIAAQDNDSFNDILLHFNPRHFQRGGQLVINDRKETRWGNDLSVPLSQLPLMFGAQSCTLIIQINSEGFDLFMQSEGNRVHCARLEHRADLPEGKSSLMLQFPSSDDYGNPENWQVFRVWWGRKTIMAGDVSGVAGANTYDSVHKKKLFISGLSKLHTDPEVDLRRAELERAFRKYGGRQGLVSVSVQKNSTFAFVEVASEQQADLALMEMKDRYKLNKARRTKHEALMEKRAADDAAASGKVTDTIDWD